MKPLLLSLLVMLGVSGVVYAQTRPLGLPQFANPPETNGADPVLYPNGVLYNTGLACSQRSNGSTWLCLASQADMTAAIAAQDAVVAATYMPTATANAAIATLTGSINTNATSISSLSGRVTTLEGQTATLQTAVTAAQSSASSAATSAATAQTAANAAQVAATTNAGAISALTTRVSGVETAIAALQALPRRLCTSFTVAAGVSVPLTGISTVQNVPLTGVPTGAVCDTGAPSRMPLGARPDPVVTTAGTVAMAFVSNAGLLSSVISIPSGTYKVCCDSF